MVDTDNGGWDFRKFNVIIKRPKNGVIWITLIGTVVSGFVSVAGNETLMYLRDDDLFAFLAQAARLPEGFDDEDGQIAWRKDDVNTNSPKTTHSSFWCAGCSSRATV